MDKQHSDSSNTVQASMMNRSLRNYYEHQYDLDSEIKSIETIKKTCLPTNRHEAIVKYFPKYFKGGSVLEIGAGNGCIAKTLLASELGISSYTLSDISEKRLEEIDKNLNDSRVRIKYIDVDDVPVQECNKYDAVLMIALIEHLIDPLGAMQKINKLIKPGGFVIVQTPNIAKYTRRIKLLLGQFPSTASKKEGLMKYSNEPVDLYDEGHLHYFTYRSLSSMLLERCNYIKVIKIPYPDGKLILGRYLHNRLAMLWPELFADVAMIVYV
jgi:2-polyprenyl-3-methyl-5-hydroxy-6-metoxy-1,4-benzoquinol methylase